MNTMTLIEGSHVLPSFIFEDDAPQESSFQIDTDDKATWAAQKIIQAENRIEKRHELATRYISRINDWLVHANQADLDSSTFLRSLLRPWLSNSLRHGGKLRSIKLLGATVGFRKRPDRLEITNPETALAFCEKEYPQAVIIKKDVSKSALKDWIHAGHIVPGIALTIGEDEITVKGA